MTPTSYLELIASFKKLITEQRNSTMSAKMRYVGGLEKLAFAAQQVSSHLLCDVIKMALYEYKV